MSRYDIDYMRLAALLLPMQIRKPRLMAMACHLTAPLRNIHSGFLEFRSEKEYRMAHNGQVCLLEKVLNEKLCGSYVREEALIKIADINEISDMLLPYDNKISEHQKHIWYDVTDMGDEEITSDNSILYDASGAVSANIVFEVRLDPKLAPGSDTEESRVYEERGGTAMLRRLLEIYKLAGKQYTIIQEI